MARKISDVFKDKSPVVKAIDAPRDKRWTRVISSHSYVEFDGDTKLNLFFDGVEKGIRLPPSQAQKLADKLGDDPDTWSGKTIEIWVSDEEFNGKPWWCAGVPRAEADDDDDVPF